MCSPRKISPTCALPARFASPRAPRARNPRGDEERTAKPRSREEEFTADFTDRADLISTGFWLLASGYFFSTPGFFFSSCPPGGERLANSRIAVLVFHTGS